MLIKAQFKQNNNITVYSELVSINSDIIENQMSSTGNHELKVRILRTSAFDNKQVRQSYHHLNVKLNTGKHYQIVNVIEDDVLKVWIIEDNVLGVVSTTSSIDTIFEKVFTLTDEIEDEVNRIKIVLKKRQGKIAHITAINKRKPRYEWN